MTAAIFSSQMKKPPPVGSRFRVTQSGAQRATMDGAIRITQGTP